MYVLPYGQMSLWGIFVPQMYNLIFIYLVLISVFNGLSSLNKAMRIKGVYRIGPHNKDVLSVIFGSLLGDAHAEKRLGGVGTRIGFFQEDSHVEYLLSLHQFLAESGYCNTKTPIMTKKLGNRGKLRKIVRFSTWTYTSFNWIHHVWYKDGKKCVPLCIDQYLTPLALAIWIMDDGSKVGKKLKFSSNSFTYNDCLMLVWILNEKFNLKASVQSAGSKDQYRIYIWKESMDNLRNIVSPYIIPEMKYKLN